MAKSLPQIIDKHIETATDGVFRGTQSFAAAQMALTRANRTIDYHRRRRTLLDQAGGIAAELTKLDDEFDDVR